MKTLLVLDDEVELLKLLSAVLRKHYIVFEADSVVQALRLFIRNGRQLDFLVADLSLETSSGIELALLLSLQIPHLPVILMSGYPVNTWSDRDATDLKRLRLRTDSVAVIQKPFSAQTLLTAARSLTEEPHVEAARTV